MNADRLLAHYERIADAPDAIGRLRRFILDLAARGKLVPQDSKDEPASELLKRIAAEKARLVKTGEIRKEKPLSQIETDEAPFDLPRGWEWVPIRKVTSDRGQMVPDNEFTYIDVTAINKEVGRIEDAKVTSAAEAPSRARKIVRKGDVLYSCIRPYLLNIAIIETEISPPPIASTAFAILNGFGLVMPRYQWIVLRSSFFVTCVEEKMRGQAYPAINDSDFSLLPFPLPSLAEQHRIVAKVDELIAVCDRLGAARAEREATRDRLAASSLARLNAPDPETFQHDARFVLNTLPALTTRPDQIKQLRQTILDLAVRGKLVPQDPKDEPASELLKRIAKEKARLVKAGEIKKEKPLEPVDDETKPFDIPVSWQWARLDVLTKLITKGSSPKWQGVDYASADEGLLFITSENVGSYELRKLDDLKYVEARFREIEPRSMLESGDILMNLVGASIGRTALYNLTTEANINQAVALIRLIEVHEGPSVNYLLHYFNSPSAIEFMLGSRVTTAQPNMSLTDTREFPVPLPPLAEQHRIVAKVDALMGLCDRLETSLTTGDDTRRRLLDALLAAALMPTSNALEAA